MRTLAILALAVPLAACTVSGPDPLMALQLPNPASLYCIEQGGTLDIRQKPEGTVSMCVLSDGTEMDEWEFYRKNHPQ